MRVRDFVRKAGNCELIVFLLLAAVALAITISEKADGPLPTWSVLYNAAGLTTGTEPPANVLTVHYIDVGQGDSILIRTPEAAMLIDAGEYGKEQALKDYFKKQKIKRIDYVTATHPHSDHIGGMPAVLGSFLPGRILMPQLSEGNTPTNTVYKLFLSAVQKRKTAGAEVIAAKPGSTFSLGEAKCTVLSPSVQSDNLNNMSVVLRLDWGKTSFLFMGDAETPVEDALMQGTYAKLLDADVLKVGHHGSSSASGQKFLQAVSPTCAVISCGRNNDYGHPHKSTLDRLKKAGAEVLRTDKNGSVRVYSDGEKVTWESDNDSSQH